MSNQPIRCAIYARKSTAQGTAEGEDRSVGRQVANARAFIEAKGWAVDERHVYVDDGISGVRTAKLVAKQRMLKAITGGDGPFQVLVMQSNDRLSRRDGDEAVSEMKAIVRAGVRIVFYSDGSEFQHGTLATNTLAYIKAEFAAEYRRVVSSKTREAHQSRARQGFVTGGRTFGYDNVRVGAHVERRINEAEAKIVRRIFELYATGTGVKSIAHQLNAKGAPCPRAQQGRVNGWCPSSVRALLRRTLYRGVQTWGIVGKRPGDDPESRPVVMPASQHTLAAVPHLRIVPDDIADRVDARFESVRRRTLRGKGGRLIGRPPGEGAKFLLTGLLSCPECGGALEIGSGTSGTGKNRSRRVHVYQCATRRRKGVTMCSNARTADMAALDSAVLEHVASAVLNPEVVERALAMAEAAIVRARDGDERGPVERELADAEKAIARITRAIASTDGDLVPLVDALKAQQQRVADLRSRLDALTSAPVVELDLSQVRQKLRGYLADWRGLLRGHVPQAQQVLRRLVVGRLTVRPLKGGHCAFEGRGTVRPLLAGVVHKLASPIYASWNQLDRWLRAVDTLRRAA